MKNRIVILQPSYLPWLVYFDQIAKTDIFVFYDDVLYTKNDWRNRNRIKSPQGAIWLTIPVSLPGRIRNQTLINQAVISDLSILKRHLKAIELNYKKALYFSDVYDLLSKIMMKKYLCLADLTIDLTMEISNYLQIKHVTFMRSSSLNIHDSYPTGRLIKLCKYFDADNYLTGASAKNYLDENSFGKSGIILNYQDYKHPIYHQLWGDFIPYLSVVDLLFNHGRNSLEILINE